MELHLGTNLADATRARDAGTHRQEERRHGPAHPDQRLLGHIQSDTYRARRLVKVEERGARTSAGGRARAQVDERGRRWT